MEAKWRRQTLLYLKLITRLSIPRRPGSASRRALSCQKEGDYNILLYKSSPPPHFPPSFLSSPSSLSVVTLFCFPLRFFHALPLSPAPRRLPRPFILLSDLSLCPDHDYNTYTDRQDENGEGVCTRKQTIVNKEL